MKKKISRRNFIGSTLASLALAGIIGCSNPPLELSHPEIVQQEIERKKYNFVLLAPDTLRQNRLGCYGYERNTSPNIDKFFSENSFKFSNAISTAGWTVPTYVAFFTGQHPIRHGVVEKYHHLPGSVQTLPEILKKEGYMSAVFAPGFYAAQNKMHGAARGSDVYNIHKEGRYDPNQYTKAINWIGENKDNPFCLTIWGLDNHSAYLPPLPFKERFVNDKFCDPQSEAFPIRDFKLGESEVVPTRRWGVTERLIEEMKVPNDKSRWKRAYDEAVAYTDHQVGRVFDFLKQEGLLDNTIVILTSDHGEQLGEANLETADHQNWYEDTLKVPYLVRVPNTKSQVIHALNQSEDVPATILDLLGIPIPESFDGRSCVPLITGERDSIRDYTFSTGPAWSAVRGRHGGNGNLYKLVIQTGTRQSQRLEKPLLFNVTRDPGELENLYEKESKIVEELRERFYDWKRRIKTGEKPKEIELDEEALESLRNFGYLD